VFLAYLSRLSLTNYRNLVSMELDLPRGVLVFFGPNAQGKTTLLEAAYTMAIARSFRAENEREVVNFDAVSRGEMALVGGALESDGSQLQIYVGYQPTLSPSHDNGASHSSPRPTWSVRKQIRVSRVRRTATELVGMVHAVLFGADDIELVFGPPSVRRRFLDILLSQTNPSYVRSLQRYQRSCGSGIGC
jgi:DNA replication and repair protein RecF